MAHSVFENIRLLVLKAIGITTPEENRELSRLTETHRHLSPLVRSLGDPEYYKSRARHLQEIDTEKELALFFKKRRSRRISRYWPAAAILLFAGSTTLYLWHKTNTPLTAPTYIATYSSKQGAVLTLSDGSSQILDGQIKAITETDGSHIPGDSLGLNYKKIGTTQTGKPIYNHLNVGRGFEYALTLEDGSKVWLNSESRLDYPIRFTDSVRRIKLSGEAYFEVVRDTTRPFLVEVNGQYDVRVLGTSFNIKAYPGDEQSETTLVQGKVAVGQIILAPSEQIIFRNGQTPEVRKVNVSNYLAWHEGWFYFENAKLENALEQIGRWYDIDFSFNSEEIRNLRVTGKLKRFENLSVILNMLTTTSGCQFEEKGATVHVSRQ